MPARLHYGETLITSVGLITIVKGQNNLPCLCIDGVVQSGQDIELDNNSAILMRNNKGNQIDDPKAEKVKLHLYNIQFVEECNYTTPRENNTLIEKFAIALQYRHLDTKTADEILEDQFVDAYDALMATPLNEEQKATMNELLEILAQKDKREENNYYRAIKFIKRAMKDNIFPDETIDLPVTPQP